MESTTKNISSSIRDNRDRGSVGQFLKDNIKADSDLSIVSAYFTIFAYHKLKDELNSINELKFLLANQHLFNRLTRAKKLQQFWQNKVKLKVV